MEALQSYSDSSNSGDEKHSTGKKTFPLHKETEHRSGSRSDHRTEHRNEYKCESRSEHKKEPRNEHNKNESRSEFKNEHRSGHKSGHKNEHRSMHRSRHCGDHNSYAAKSGKSSHLHERGRKFSRYSRSRSRSPVRRIPQSEYKRRQISTPSVPPVSEKCSETKVEDIKKVQLPTVPKVLPSVNTMKFETIQEKRKRLWSSKKEKAQSGSQWESATFGDGGDEAQAKFRRLMGMSMSSVSGNEAVKKKDGVTVLKKLEQQYESSRYLTHVARGVGLGFASLNSEQTDEQQQQQ